MNKTDLQKEFDLHNRTITYKDYFAGEKSVRYVPLGIHDSEETAIVIDDYPYGYTLRTKIRYWIESTKRGDRFVTQTLNPKTNKWNNPKKSTYSDVMVMVAFANGHVSTLDLCYNDDKTKADAFLEAFDEQLTDKQKRSIHAVKGWSQAMERVTFKCTAQRFRHKTTGEITTSVPIFELKDYEKIDENDQAIDEDKEEREKKETRQRINQMAAGYANLSLREVKNGKTN